MNGKVRDRFEVAGRAGPRTSWSRGRKASREVQAHLDGKETAQAIVVPDKLVNFVVGSAGALSARECVTHA